MRRYRNVPPLQFLQGFEAAARLGNFSKAAEELGLSQSAVSHQMRLLEERLGQPLFLRVGRHVRLTDAGRDYSRTVTRALAELDTGYRRLEPYRKPRSVVIYAPREPSHPLSRLDGAYAPAMPLQPQEQAAVIAFAERASTLTQARQEELANIAAPTVGSGGALGVRRLQGVANWLLGRA